MALDIFQSGIKVFQDHKAVKRFHGLYEMLGKGKAAKLADEIRKTFNDRIEADEDGARFYITQEDVDACFKKIK